MTSLKYSYIGQILVLRYVGISVSLGHPLNVPILIRSLADSMGHLHETDLPIPIDNDFISLLDSDLAEQNYVCRLVAKYDCAWWIGRKPRIIEMAETMKSTSMARFVENHLNQLDGSNSELDRLLNPGRKALNTSISKDTKCPKCPKYKQILSDTLQDLLRVHRLTSTVLSGSEAKWHIDMRRASAFNLLHEAIILKEISGTPSASSNRMTSHSPQQVEEKARQELARLQDQLPSSHKWTWGESLTKSEVLTLRRSGSRRKIHSGYDLSLRDVDLGGDDSPMPSHPKTSEIVGHAKYDTCDTESSIPDNKFPDIQYFRQGKNVLYDPLGKNDITFLPLALESSKLSTHNLELHTKSMNYNGTLPSIAHSEIEKNKTAQGRDVAEDIWSSASEAGNPVVGKGKQSQVHDAEELWSSASETGNPVVGKGKESQIHEADDMWSSASDTGPAIVEKNNDVDKMWTSTSEKGQHKTGRVAADQDIKSAEKEKDDDDLWSSASEAGPAAVEKDKDVDEMWTSASEKGQYKTDRVAADQDIKSAEKGKDNDDMWSSASEAGLAAVEKDKDVDEMWNGDEDAEINNGDIPTSQISVNSRLMVSPSRITIPTGHPIFPLSDVWPDLNIPELPPNVPPAGSYRRFGPEDFQNLQDHMFEDRDSDSESSDE